MYRIVLLPANKMWLQVNENQGLLLTNHIALENLGTMFRSSI